MASTVDAPLGVDNELALRMYRQMLRIRAFEEAANDLYRGAKMPGPDPPLHGAGGGRRRRLRGVAARRLHHVDTPGARALSGERGRRAPDVRGVARQGGRLLPRQGRLDAHRRLRATAISARTPSSAGSAGIATGAAQSAKMRGTDQVVVCFFGEGALGQGLLYEVMNMAALWSLPVIYLCENNQYNEYTHFSETTAGDILARAAAFGIPGEEVDGQDVLAVNAVVRRAVQRGARGRAARPSSSRTRTATTGITSETSTGSTTARRRRRRSGGRIAIRSSGSARGSSRRGRDQRGARARRRATRATRSTLGVEYALAAPFPAESEVALHVYA